MRSTNVLGNGVALPAAADASAVLSGIGFATASGTDEHRIGEAGFIEEERLISTLAQVYEDSDGALRVIASGVPITTRILVRRPAQADAFSGMVFLELLNAAEGYDTAEIWGSMGPWLMERGHAWVGMTAGPVAADALVHWNPERYRDVTWSRTEGVAPASLHVQDPGFQPTAVVDGAEEGLVWDALTALALRLRADEALLGKIAQKVIAVGHGMAGVQLNTFANTLHNPYAQLAGCHILDGYLNVGGGGIRRTLRQDSTMAGIASWRPARPPQLQVPHITVSSEGDFVLFGSALLARRNDLGPRVRHYQVPGAPHRDVHVPRPSGKDAARAGRRPRTEDGASSVVPLAPVVEAMALALERWVSTGLAAPESRWLALDERGQLLRDEVGNSLGGVRTGLTDMPIARITGASAEHLDGETHVLSAAAFTERYGSAQDYFTWFEIIDGVCLAEGYLTARGVAQNRSVASALLAQIGVAQG